MSTDEPQTTTEATDRTDGPDLGLWPWQYDSVFSIDEFQLVYLIGGRGSGKSYTDAPRVLRWSELCTDLHYGIFAATEAQLHTVLAPIVQCLDDIGIKHRYESQAPAGWRATWDFHGIAYPPRRLRQHKIWIWEDGTHIFTGSIVNHAYTRAKSLDFNAILLQEGTEPGVTADAIDTLMGTLRCGKARRDDDGRWRCNEPGHLHQLVLAGNVPLNDPSHWIYRRAARLQQAEAKRRQRGARPFFRMINSATTDNPATGEDYLDRLKGAWDEATFRQQTSGLLERNIAATSYYSFSEQNVLGTLVYDPRRPLHMWFDFNATPAAVGWGHDLRPDEVPDVMLRAGKRYFGVVGELFSGGEACVTAQVAPMLVEDPSGGEGRCLDCGDIQHEHTLTALGYLCRVCGWFDKKTRRHCSGRMTEFQGKNDFIHAPANWRGLAQHRGPIYLYGDASGNQERSEASAPGQTNIKILRDIIGALGQRVHFRFPSANPPIKMRVLAVNRDLCNQDGTRTLFFAPWVTAHLDDAREVVPDPKTGEPLKRSRPKNAQPGDYSERTHCFDGLGYQRHYVNPPIIPKSAGYGGIGVEAYDSTLPMPREVRG